MTSRRRRLIRSWNGLHCTGPVAHPVPVAEQPVRQREQPPADLLAAAAPVDHRLEIAAQMRPADSVATDAMIHSYALNRSLPTT